MRAIRELLPRAAVRSEVPFAKFGMGVGEALEAAEAITVAAYELDHPYLIHLVDGEFRRTASLYAHPAWQSCTWCLAAERAGHGAIHLFDGPCWEAGHPRAGLLKTATATFDEVAAADRSQLQLESDHDCF